MSELRQRTPMRKARAEADPVADAIAEPETKTETVPTIAKEAEPSVESAPIDPVATGSHAASSFLKVTAVCALIFHFSWMALKDLAGDQNPLDFYANIRKSNPFLTNVLENDVICILSQAISFLLKVNMSKEPVDFDWKGVFILLFITTFYVVPVLTKFFAFMSTWTLGGVVGNVAFNQFVFSPVFNFGFMALYTGLGSPNDSFDNVLRTALKILPSALFSSWLFWIPQTYINVTYVPGDMQILFGSACGLVWNIILSFILAK